MANKKNINERQYIYQVEGHPENGKISTFTQKAYEAFGAFIYNNTRYENAGYVPYDAPKAKKLSPEAKKAQEEAEKAAKLKAEEAEIEKQLAAEDAKKKATDTAKK